MLFIHRAVRLLVFIGVATAGSGLSRNAEAALAQFYYGGANSFGADPAPEHLSKIGELPETQRLKDDFARNVAGRLMERYFEEGKDEIARNASVLISDLYEIPFYLRIGQETGEEITWMLAVELPESKREEWIRSLESVSEEFPPESKREFNSSLAEGWEATAPSGHSLRVLTMGEWVMISGGYHTAPGFGDTLENLVTRGHPFELTDDQIVSGEVDLSWAIKKFPRLAALIDDDKKNGTVRFAVTPSTGSLRTEAEIRFETPLDLEMPAWNVPTGSIQDPLSSFLAVRGVRPLLDDIDFLNEIELPVPDQAFIWSRSGVSGGTNSMAVPFLTYLAAPMNNATNVLRHSVEKYQQVFPETHPVARLFPARWFEDMTRVVTDRLPIIRPYVDVAAESSGEFLVAGLFPVAEDSGTVNPAPGELFDQFTGDDQIILYHWEITQLRLKQLYPIFQLADMASSTLHPAADPAAPHSIYGGHEWLTASGAYLGNSVTQLKLTAPDTIAITRQSPIGLTAFELTRLFKDLIGKGLLAPSVKAPAP